MNMATDMISTSQRRLHEPLRLTTFFLLVFIVSW